MKPAQESSKSLKAGTMMINEDLLLPMVRHGDEHLLVTKGEAESVFAICNTVMIGGAPQMFDESQRAEAEATFN